MPRGRSNEMLAVHGGEPVRSTRMPPRFAFGSDVEQTLQDVIEHYRALDADPGYQGHFEDRYCAAFVGMMGGGHADAVATGTAAVYVALAALELPSGSDVLVSPITDPGTLSAIILLGLRPKLLDARPGDYNIGAEQVAERLDENVSCVIAVHLTGSACEVGEIANLCRARDVRLLEDCSQAHGARHGGRLVGTFGDIAAFSTMYRKTSIAGSSGGVVYTTSQELHRRALAYADRGKPTWREDFDPRDPSGYLFPALNLHTDELSCAIGVASLSRLGDTIARRQEYFRGVSEGLKKASSAVETAPFDTGVSPFIIPTYVAENRIACGKTEFAEAVRAEGIDLNPHYMYLVEDWPWIRPYLADDHRCTQARQARDSSFCLYVNENYGEAEVVDTVQAILKVEAHFGR